MVLLHIKKGDDSQFLYETSVKASLAEVVPQVAVLFNERKRLERLIAGNFC